MSELTTTARPSTVRTAAPATTRVNPSAIAPPAILAGDVLTRTLATPAPAPAPARRSKPLWQTLFPDFLMLIPGMGLLSYSFDKYQLGEARRQGLRKTTAYAPWKVVGSAMNVLSVPLFLFSRPWGLGLLAASSVVRGVGVNNTLSSANFGPLYDA